jgi:hypothetical protein
VVPHLLAHASQVVVEAHRNQHLRAQGRPIPRLELGCKHAWQSEMNETSEHVKA